MTANGIKRRLALLAAAAWLCALLGAAFAQGGTAYRFLERRVGQRPFALACQISDPQTWPAESGVRIGFDYVDDENQCFLLLMAGRAAFFEVVGGQKRQIGSVGLLPQGPFRLVLKRSSWEVAAYADGRPLCFARRDLAAGERVGVAVTPNGPRCAVEALQPIEPVYFTDSFMRNPDEPNPWEPVAGVWTATGQRDPEITPAHSANPFMFRAFRAKDGPALVVAGSWYWRDYCASVAVRPDKARAVGLCIYLQDKQNCLLFRWASAIGEDEAQIIRLAGGEQTLLARARGGFLPGQWYRIGLRASGGRVQALVDGRVVCDARDEWFGQGRVGLYAEGEGVCALFDDLSVEPWTWFGDDFSQTERGGWRDFAGGWETDSSAGRRVLREGGPSYTVIGARPWDNLTVSATVFRPGRAVAGLCAAWEDEKNHVDLRWAGKSLKLIRVREGEETVLASAPPPMREAHTARLALQCDEGYWQGYFNGKLVLRGIDRFPTAGKVGVYGQSAGVACSAFDVTFRDRATLDYAVGEEPRLPEIFQDDEIMDAWAAKASEWKKQQGGFFRHEGDLFVDPFISFPAPDTDKPWAMTAVIRATDGANSGYALALRGDGKGKVSWTLTRAGEPVAAEGPRELTVEGGEELTLEQRGHLIVARAGGVPFAIFRDPQPLRGTQVCLAPSQAGIEWSTVSVGCKGLLDEKFTGAPVAWWAHSGTWDVTQRWTCQPQWSFFGGHGSLTPTLWSKASFGGDFTVEGFLATPMDIVRSERSPADLNVTVCGNGADVCTGYTFVFAGWGKKKNALYRNGEKIAEQPYRRDLWANIDVHQDWFHIRIERRGARLVVFVEGQKLFQYDDPEPLPGGHVAFWTYNGAIQLARVRVWYERPGPTDYAPTVAALRRAALVGLRPSAPPEKSEGLSNDFERSLGDFGIASKLDGAVALLDDGEPFEGKRCLKVWNATSGGYFTLRAVRHRFDAQKYPKLRFAYRLSPRVRVNLYAKINGRWYDIGFAGPPGRLGAIADVVADGKWHVAEFDLLAALRQARAKSTEVEELAFAAPDMEARMGLTANPLGATYYLDDFRLEPAQGPEETSAG